MQSGERWLENRYTGNNQKKKKKKPDNCFGCKSENFKNVQQNVGAINVHQSVRDSQHPEAALACFPGELSHPEKVKLLF